MRVLSAFASELTSAAAQHIPFACQASTPYTNNARLTNLLGLLDQIPVEDAVIFEALALEQVAEDALQVSGTDAHQDT
jgi:hypothetical protein